MAEALAFVPGIGFRARDGLLLRAPITAERGEWTVTIDRLATGPQQTELGFTLSGPLECTQGERPAPRALNDPVSVRASSGRVLEQLPVRYVPGSWSIGAVRSIRRLVTLGPLGEKVPRVEVVLGGEVGEWVIPLDLVPLDELGIAALSTDISDTHHGVRISVRAVARGNDTIAIDAHTSFDPTPPLPRFMRSLGTGPMHPPRLRQSGQFTLRTGTGDEVTEFASVRDGVEIGCDLHEVALFGALPATATSATLTIPIICVADHTGVPVTLPVPSEAEITLGAYRARARVARFGDQGGGTGLQIEFDGGGWHDDRLFLYAESVSVEGVRQAWSPRVEGLRASVSTGDPKGAAREVVLDSPVAWLRGPWTIEIPLTRV